MFLDYLKTFVKSEKLNESNIAVALSGGADSVSLFFALKSIACEFSLSLAVVHVNYQLRGSDSERDYEFVKDIAETSSVPFFSKTVTLDPNRAVEEQARNIRYDFFTEIQERRGFEYIAVGHTRDDQAETVLFRLLRGTGLHGAAGMEAVREDFIIRPILMAGREECRNWLVDQGITWREDLSNQDNYYRRNLIRNEILPLIKKVNPGAVEHLADFSNQCCRGSAELLKSGMRRLKANGLWEEEQLFHFNKRCELDEAVLTALASLLRNRGCSFSELHMTTLISAGERSGKTTLLPGGWRVFSSFKKLLFFHEKHSPFTSFEMVGADIVDGLVCHGMYQVDSVGANSVIRSLRDDDRFYLNGVEKNILAFLKKKGVPSLERKKFPVISVDGVVVDIAKFRV